MWKKSSLITVCKVAKKKKRLKIHTKFIVPVIDPFDNMLPCVGRVFSYFMVKFNFFDICVMISMSTPSYGLFLSQFFLRIINGSLKAGAIYMGHELNAFSFCGYRFLTEIVIFIVLLSDVNVIILTGFSVKQSFWNGINVYNDQNSFSSLHKTCDFIKPFDQNISKMSFKLSAQFFSVTTTKNF